MLESVNNHIRSINFGYSAELRKMGIKHYNKFATFKDAHTLELADKKGAIETVTAKYIAIASGGRPTYPGVPGDKECCITSDDIFWMTEDPGKTLVVGASYVALECAGFLNGIGKEVTVMVRSILLRGFDQQIAAKIREDMEILEIDFIDEATPSKFEKQDDGKIKVYYNQGGMEVTAVFDTVLLAIGRSMCTPLLNLENAGLKVNKSGKFETDDEERTNVPHIFALGDNVAGNLELTPVAIQQGKRLARRLFDGAIKKMNYKTIPTTVFTPLEYGSCGYS